MSSVRPRPKALQSQLRSSSFAGPDMTRQPDPTLRYVELHRKTPWTTSQKGWRAATAPLSWPQELREAVESQLATGPTEEELEEDPFVRERAELVDMRKSANKINKFYIPISKLPPLGGMDPKAGFGTRPPSFYVDYSVPRASKLMDRWESMPHLRSQLPIESLQKIQAATKKDKPRPNSRDRLSPGTCGSTGRWSGRSNSGRGDRSPGLPRNDTDARLTKALRDGDGSARGKKEHPHIPCDCCDHQAQKPWMQSSSVPGSSRPASQGRYTHPVGPAGRAATPIWKNTAVNPEEDRSRVQSRQSQSSRHEAVSEEFPAKHRHTVSWEDPEGSSDGGSEHWEETL